MFFLTLFQTQKSDFQTNHRSNEKGLFIDYRIPAKINPFFKLIGRKVGPIQKQIIPETKPLCSIWAVVEIQFIRPVQSTIRLGNCYYSIKIITHAELY